MHKAGLIVLEGLHGGLGPFLLGHQSREVGDPMAAQAAVQAGARDLGRDEFPRDRDPVVQGQQQDAAQGDDHRLLGRGQGGVQAVRAMGAVRPVRAAAPFTYPVLGQRRPAGPLCDRKWGLPQLAAEGRGGAGILM